MSSSLITSKDNKIYKLINSLKKPKYRKKNSMFILEGKRLVYEAIERSGCNKATLCLPVKRPIVRTMYGG